MSQANMTLNPGELWASLGIAATGGSTLGLMLAGLLRPTSGEILYQGEPVRLTRGLPPKCPGALSAPGGVIQSYAPLIRSMEGRTRFISSPYGRKFSTGTLPALVSGRSTCSDTSGAQRRELAGILVLGRPTRRMLDVITQAQMVPLYYRNIRRTTMILPMFFITLIRPCATASVTRCTAWTRGS